MAVCRQYIIDSLVLGAVRSTLEHDPLRFGADAKSPKIRKVAYAAFFGIEWETII